MKTPKKFDSRTSPAHENHKPHIKSTPKTTQTHTILYNKNQENEEKGKDGTFWASNASKQ